MNRQISAKSLTLFSALLLGGCASSMLKERAAFDLQCPEEQLTLHDAGAGAKGVRGCGQQVTYVWVPSVGWTLNTDSRPAPDSEPAPSQASDSPSSEPADSKSEGDGEVLYSNLAPDTEYPKDAVGFEFGSTPDAAQAVCESAGHAWVPTASGAGCTGLPKDVGAPGKSQLRFCGEKLCRLGIAVTVDEGNLSVPIGIWTSLNKKYGKPVKSETKVPASCRETMYDCIASGEAVMNNIWRWNDDSKITAKFESKDGEVFLMLYYVLEMDQSPSKGVEAGPTEDYSDTF